MTAELIYRTTSTAALQWRRDYMDRWREARTHWDAFELAIEDAIGIPDGEKHRSLYMLHGAVIGVVRTTQEGVDRRNYAARFPGWKEHQRFPILVPRLNTKAGKEWQAKIDALPKLDMRTEAKVIGIPDYVLTDHRMFSAGIDFDEEGDKATAIYQLWGSGACEKTVLHEQAKHPEIEWTEVPRSQWYARLEAAEKQPA